MTLGKRMSEMKDSKSPQDVLREQILAICRKKYLSLGEIAHLLEKNKHTIRAGYIYPMVKEGLLEQEHPAGTKSTQRYKSSKRGSRYV